MPFVYLSTSEEATAAFGRRLAQVLPDGSVVALLGTLGAGKTRLVQAIAEACGVPRDEVVSPTFVLIQEYHGGRDVYHIDAYRLRDDDEFWELGPDEYYSSGGIVLIEWADRVAGCLPREYLEVEIEVTGDTDRNITLKPRGEAYSALVAQLEAEAPRGGNL
jgi:tRNA threonylcarbamoyladenosine biosynthesis protein TsaE